MKSNSTGPRSRTIDPVAARDRFSANARFKTALAPKSSSPKRRPGPARGALRRAACALLLAAGLLWPSASRAARSVPVPGTDPVFELVILDRGESDFYFDDKRTSSWQLEPEAGESVENGVEYWVNVLELGADSGITTPLRVLVSTYDENNADAISVIMPSGDTQLGEAIFDGGAGGEFLAAIHWGFTDCYLDEVSPLPRNGNQQDASATIVHEMGHALGITCAPSSASDPDGYAIMSNFSDGLRDLRGCPLNNEEGMEIHLAPDADTKPLDGYLNLKGDPENHQARSTGLHFTGDNVLEVLEGAELSFPEDYTSRILEWETGFTDTVPGIPVNGYEMGEDENGEEQFVGEFSHLELQNCLMSHQFWSNWGVFMEAELAVLQDIGYSIDRGRFFGRSIYMSGVKEDLNLVVNDRPYYERENGEWLEGVASTTPWGIGLHVYGSWNDVRQVADILTVGDLATGVRLEGVGNRLTVGSGVNVRADGREGTGLLVSYGRDHEVNVKGTVTALGEGGVAARFDFGDNQNGNDTEYRGSYMWQVFGKNVYDKEDGTQLVLDKINGPLVKEFNVSGALLGSEAAVFIDESAYVKEINILSGATLAGDIVSNWNPDNSKIVRPDDMATDDQLHTALTFGLAANADGTPGAPDPDFVLAYDGDIQGAKSFDMSLKGGTLALAGDVNVYSLVTGEDTTLALLKAGEAPQVTVSSSFSLGNNATLATAFTGNGAMARISAGSIATGLNPSWTLVPTPDWYANGDLRLETPVVAKIDNVFEPKTVSVSSSSPTLSFQLAEGAGWNGSGATVSVSRQKDAYARYASSSGDAEIGRALQSISDSARGEMRTLLANMDWSGPDGSGVRAGLSRLSPEAYDAVARATLDEQSAFSRILLDRMLADFAGRQARTLMGAGASTKGGAATPAEGGADNREGRSAPDSLRSPDADRWTVWAAPYGSGSFQNAHGSSSAWSSTGVGLVLGADRSFDSGLTLGGHVALAAKRVHIEDRAEGRADTKSAYAGLQAFFAPQVWSGFWLTAQGRLGIESGEMDREVRVGSYSRTAEGNWSGFAGSALLGGGKDFATALGDGALVAGPLAWFEYAFLNRPSFGESGGGAANLDVDAALYESFLMNLGGHAALRTVLDNGTTLGVDLLAAWRHELSRGRFATTAAFSDYGDHSFTSDSDLPGRDSLLARGGFTLADGHGFSARLEAGVELFREDFTAVDVGLRFAWEF